MRDRVSWLYIVCNLDFKVSNYPNLWNKRTGNKDHLKHEIRLKWRKILLVHGIKYNHDCRARPYFDSVSIFKFADGIFICDLFIAKFHSVTPVKRPNVILGGKKNNSYKMLHYSVLMKQNHSKTGKVKWVNHLHLHTWTFSLIVAQLWLTEKKWKKKKKSLKWSCSSDVN